MLSILLAFSAILLLILFRWWIQKRLQGIILLLGGSKRLAISFYSIIFLPGVIVHEVAHFLFAALLAVPTGEVSIFPKSDQFDSHKSDITLGSVKMAKTDPIRSSIIGFAPFMAGSMILFLISHLVFKDLIDQPNLLQSFQWLSQNRHIFAQPLIWLWLYLTLAVSNTMFMSKSDMRGWPWFILLTGIIVGLIILTGQLAGVANLILPRFIQLTQALGISFTFAIIIDILVIITLFALEKIIEKVSRRRIVYGRG